MWSAVIGFEEELSKEQRRGPGELAGISLQEYVETRKRRKGARLNVLLIFDQFEEILRTDPTISRGRRGFSGSWRSCCMTRRCGRCL